MDGMNNTLKDVLDMNVELKGNTTLTEKMEYNINGTVTNVDDEGFFKFTTLDGWDYELHESQISKVIIL
jgi:hypothetical protein